jgi:hypothetical protein
MTTSYYLRNGCLQDAKPARRPCSFLACAFSQTTNNSLRGRIIGSSIGPIMGAGEAAIRVKDTGSKVAHDLEMKPQRQLSYTWIPGGSDLTQEG